MNLSVFMTKRLKQSKIDGIKDYLIQRFVKPEN